MSESAVEVTEELLAMARAAGACDEIDEIAVGTPISTLPCGILSWASDALPRDVVREAVGDVPPILCGTYGRIDADGAYGDCASFGGGHGDGFCDGSGYGYGCDGYYGVGDGDGAGCADGSGIGFTDGGSGYGYDHGDGFGDGDGYGYGASDGSGYGASDGSGFGNGLENDDE